MLMCPIGMALNNLNYGPLLCTIYNFAKGVAWASKQLGEKEGKKGKFAPDFFMHI